MNIIDYGYKLAELTDKDFWQTYNFDITRLSTHNHDGVNSAFLVPGHLQPTYQLVDTGDWTGPVDEVYTSPNIALPSNVTWPTTQACPVVVKGFDSTDKVVNVEYLRVDDDNFAVQQKTNQSLTLALY